MSAPSKVQRQELLFRSLARFESTRGRWCLRTRLRAQRLAWHCALHSGAWVKRLLDLTGSCLALVLLSPLFALIIIAIRCEGPGPAMFTQTRVGRQGRLFKIYKFRSMHVDAEARLHGLLASNQHRQGVTFKLKHDPRVTRVGHWLRKLSFDELPQFFNVLVGDMSLVGPRPPIPREVAHYTLADRRRLAAPPGITCIWQISGRAEIDFPQQVELDVLYIETQCLWQDLRILAKTLPAVVFGGGAY
jgi:lipopolysaccharide/colanic/teichoic acid biosynthesis glycosyltransferase